ncbi:hypothetical protein Dxin01_02883 [Deinococcus xinjiangensis]|uniref:Uncharacterized protein n=1 Tax=Deinococcus xinjiangensis TaxID=457454 RepID=A0ABP9VD18_9DEIO
MNETKPVRIRLVYLMPGFKPTQAQILVYEGGAYRKRKTFETDTEVIERWHQRAAALSVPIRFDNHEGYVADFDAEVC